MFDHETAAPADNQVSLQAIEGELTVSSKNHGLLQGRLAGFINYACDHLNAATELSLDMEDPRRREILVEHSIHALRELKPDVAVYDANDFDFADPDEEDDQIRVKEVPLCCMEIVSPSQSSRDILNKFRVYFKMGVKSCWFIDPNLKEIRIYNSMKQKQHFIEVGEVVDEVLKVQMPMNKIFGKKGRQNKAETVVSMEG